MQKTINKCENHDDCLIITINDCEFHTNTRENRRMVIEEIEYLEEPRRANAFMLRPCEKAPTCAGATIRCTEPIFTEKTFCDPSKRWMYCYEWHKKLGMIFDRDLGTYILPEWRVELLKRAEKC